MKGLTVLYADMGNDRCIRTCLVYEFKRFVYNLCPPDASHRLMYFSHV